MDRRNLYLVIAGIAVGSAAVLLWYTLDFARNDNYGFNQRISQEEAIAIVENDLGRLYSNYSQMYIMNDARNEHVELSEFQATNQHVPLFLADNEEKYYRIDSNDGNATWEGSCGNRGSPQFCGYLDLNYRDKLVYYFDMNWRDTDGNQIDDGYVVDAVEGKVVDSFFLRKQADERYIAQQNTSSG